MPRSRIRSGKLAAQTLSNGLIANNSIIASARNLTLRPAGPVKRIRAVEWQRACWHSYDVIEVFHYAVQWVGNTLSRAKLVAMKDGVLLTEGPAFDILNEFFGGPDLHGEFLRQAAVHMTVAGDAYLVEERSGDEDWWGVVAAIEMRETATGYKFDGEELDPANSLVMRFWRPHPVRPNQSDCPTRPLLPVLNQMEKLTMYVDAQLDSRLTGSGIMVFPNSMAFPVPAKDGEDTSQQAGLLAFMKEWAETMSAAKQDPSSPSARVPTAAMGEGEDLDKIRHITTWTELDDAAPALREESVRRIALGLDMPADALIPSSGAGGGENHWGAWQTDDSLIKSHAEPLLALICQALTTDYLRVILEDKYGMAWEDAAAFTIEADTADMRLRPNRSKEAMEMWDRGELNGAALRRENGFEEADAMLDDEKKDWLLRKVAQGSPSPEFVQWAANQLGIPVPEIAPADQQVEAPRGERPLPRSLKDHPTNDPPERPAAAAALLAAGEVSLFRALERAGNRAKNFFGRDAVPSGVKAMDLYQYVTMSREQLNDALSDAWSNLDRLTLPEGVSLEAFETALDNYARMLISSRRPYDRDLLAKYLVLAFKEAA